MFERLRWKLTVFNTVVTGAILVCTITLCLTLSEQNMKDQAIRNFSDTVQAISSYLDMQSQISDGWLRQMEADPNIHISISDAGKPLFSMGLSKEKSELEPIFSQAKEYAGLRYNESNPNIFAIGDYYASVCTISKKDSAVELILLYSLVEINARICQQRLLVCFATLAAIGALCLFSWLFTDKLLRPIQDNQRKQTEFIAAASHELRTPLAAILSATSAMEQAESVQRAQFSDMIHREGKRMSRLISDMLTLASSDSKAWVLQKEPVELDMLLLEVYETQLLLAKEQNISLTLSLYEQELPTLKLDRDRIAQVLSILLDNARHYTPANGRIELELTVHRNRVQIRISDTGPGIPNEEKDRVFERFYSSERSRSHRGHFGLGLSIAFEIIRKHNGKIWVEDATIGGAEFVIEIPMF